MDDGVEPIADAEMDNLRGGFAIHCLQIGFGATVTTCVNGMPVLETLPTITDAGRLVQPTLSQIGESLASLGAEADHLIR